MEVIIVVGGVDGDVRLRLILVAARFFAFSTSWIVSTSPLSLDQQEVVVVVCALEQDSLCGRLPRQQLRRASKQVECNPLPLCCLIPTWLGDRLLVCFPQPPSTAILDSILLSDYFWTRHQRPQTGKKCLTSRWWCVEAKCTAGPPRATNCQTGDVASSTLPTGHHQARAVVG